MNRYDELGRELDKVLAERREASKDRYGFSAADGKEMEWSRANERAAAIRKELRRLRYGEYAD